MSVHLGPGYLLDGRYELSKVIGTGSMAEVWAAMDMIAGHPVAIKVVAELLLRNSQVHKRFEREMIAISQIQHPNVVSMLGHGQVEDGRPFMVMELMEGQSLAEYLEQSQMLGAFSTVMLTMQILEGLEAAHQKGIVHRDLKPANVFLAKTKSGKRQIKVLDFGVARVLNPLDRPLEKLTRTGSIVGSPRYMSLEVAKGQKDVDHRCDIFSTGAIMYHALAGAPPFQGNALGQVLLKIFEHDFPPLTVIRPDLPAGLIGCVEKAMAHTAEERFQSAPELRAALDEIVEIVKPKKYR